MRETTKKTYRLPSCLHLPSCCLFRKDRQPQNEPNEIELSGVINSTPENKKPQLKNGSKNTRHQLNKMKREAKKRTNQRTQNNQPNALPNTNQQPECQQTTTHIKYGNLANVLDNHANGTTDRNKTTTKAKTTENSHKSPQYPTTEGSVFVPTESHLMHNIPTLAADLSREIEERRNKKNTQSPKKCGLE